MSYAPKYTLTFRENPGTATTGNLYKINIYQNNYVGSTSTIKASDNPITLSYKKQDLINPIVGSELTIGIMSTTNGQYLEFATAAPLQYYVDVLKSADQGVTWFIYWSGVNTTDCYTEPYQNAPYPINLKFNCGLGELQWHRYENAGALVNGLESLSLIISNCLSFLPFSKRFREIINIREDTMADASGFLEQTYLMDESFTEIADDGELHGINCNKLLNQLLTSIGCRMYQSCGTPGNSNMWFIERTSERVNQSVNYFDYAQVGGFQNPGTSVPSIGSGTFTLNVNINNASTPKLINGGDWAVTKKMSGLSYKFNTSSFDSVELVTNPFFEDTPTTKTATGLPTQWDFGSKYNPYIGTSHLQLQTVNPWSSDLKYRFGLVMDSNVLQAFNTDMGLMEQAHSIGFSYGLSNLYYPWMSSGGINNWGIHAVRRTGDTYSNPWVYIDPVNGSLQININFFVRFMFLSTGWSAATTNSYPAGDAYKLSVFYGAGPSFFMPIRIGFYDNSGNWYYMSIFNFDQAQSTNWIKGSLSTSETSAFGLSWFNICNFCCPDVSFTGQVTPLTGSQLSGMMKTSYNTGKPFYVAFNLKYSFNIPFNTTVFGTTPAPYKFDLTMFPPVVGPSNTGYASDLDSAISQGLSQTLMQIDAFGIDTVDVQYKDSYNSMSGYTKFYSSTDINNRWSEQKIDITYGDSITPGYPGSFRLSNANPTKTWHAQGNSNPFKFDTGRTNADPGTGKFRFNNATISSATSIYVDDTNNNSVSVASWMAAMVSGKALVFSDNANGNQYIFTTGTPISHTGYYEIPVTYVSGSGSFSSLDIVQLAYQGNQFLADIIFQPLCNLLAQYRRSITGKIYMPGGIPFYNSVLDEDGTLYAQTGSQFDFKKGMLTINLEEMTQNVVTVSTVSTQSTTQMSVIGNKSSQSATAATGQSKAAISPIGSQVAIGNNIISGNYPVS